MPRVDHALLAAPGAEVGRDRCPARPDSARAVRARSAYWSSPSFLASVLMMARRCVATGSEPVPDPLHIYSTIVIFSRIRRLACQAIASVASGRSQRRPRVLAIDQGTTNSKAVLVDDGGLVRASAPLRSGSPPTSGVGRAGRRALWTSVLTAIERCLLVVDGAATSTSPAWPCPPSGSRWWLGPATGRPLGPVIGWQDVRTAAWCRDRTGPVDDRAGPHRTGLRIDAMFSAPKIGWLLRESAGRDEPRRRLRRHRRLLADLAADRRRACT